MNLSRKRRSKYRVGHGNTAKNVWDLKIITNYQIKYNLTYPLYYSDLHNDKVGQRTY